MRVLFDTSVLVAAIVEGHPEHARSFSWLKRASEGEVEMIVSTHTLAELYAVLTRLPVRPRIDPAMARRIIRENVESIGRIKSISVRQYKSVLDHLAAKDLAGGIVYDAMHACVAAHESVDRLLTLNRKDFLRAWSGKESVVCEP